MSGLKTFLILLVAMPLPAQATDASLMATFANCAGRFSAEMEHAWLMSDPRSDEFKQYRAKFIDLLEAVMSAEETRLALKLRIDAKLAHAALLTRATFSQDAEQLEWADERADAEIRQCSAVILGS